MTNSTVMEIEAILSKEDMADTIAWKWDELDNQRQGWKNEVKELRNFVFATDTAGTLETDGDEYLWNNRTTLPKLCQIRDNLHANYLSALFPNDDWLKWEGYTLEDSTVAKKETIQAYMSNKARMSNLSTTVSKLLYDYIDYGIAIADVMWVNESKIDPETGEKIPGYIGPKLVRISPLDIVFDPTASEFEGTVKITRSIVRMGELELMAKDNPQGWIDEAISHAQEVRGRIGGYRKDDVDKAAGFSIDGFGDLATYYGSGYVELLEFEGTMHDPQTGELLDDYIITVADRTTVVRKEPIPAWKRNGFKVMSGWRKRPDNLYAMGPLANLVGMQYRIDHLENAKADGWDLIITPMFKIIGDVDEFEFQPGGEVHIGEGGDVVPLTVPKEVLAANNEIGFQMELMEQFAGAPKQAMGIRTPGEKTAFEVQSLENAAGRIFQEKITQFEVELLEPCLNNMLMVAVKHMNASDVIRVMDDDLGLPTFSTITKEDITANGILRPVGARHFAHRAQLIQNLTGVTNSPVWQKVERHFSDIALAKLIEDSLQLQRFAVVTENAGMFEQAEGQRQAQQLQEDIDVEASTPLQEDV